MCERESLNRDPGGGGGGEEEDGGLGAALLCVMQRVSPSTE